AINIIVFICFNLSTVRDIINKIITEHDYIHLFYGLVYLIVVIISVDYFYMNRTRTVESLEYVNRLLTPHYRSKLTKLSIIMLAILIPYIMINIILNYFIINGGT